MTTQLIPVNQLHDNRYQGRQVYEDIETLGRSIANDDLQEIPKARKNGRGFELKFGHRRREAFRWLAEHWKGEGLPDRYQGYSVMPVDVEAFSDEDMFRGAVVENEHRRSLNPIEQAKMMIRYRDEFGKTSDEIGALWGMSGSTVRGLIRLPALPDPIQEKIGSGEVPQGTARKLVTAMNTGMTTEDLVEIVAVIGEGEEAEDAIELKLKSKENTVMMWESWRRDETPLGGDGLWKLSTTPEKLPAKHLPAMTVPEAAKIVGGEWTGYNDKIVLQNRINHFQGGGTVETMPGYKTTIEVDGEAAHDVYERLAHLINPPSCVGCPFHVVLDRSHYCTFKPCHQRKTKAFVAGEMERISKKLGIPVYDPETDGKAGLALSENTYEDAYKVHVKLVEKKDPALRIAPHNHNYSTHKWTDSSKCRLVLVGERAQAIKEKQRAKNAEKKEKDSNSYEAQQRQWRIQNQNRDASNKFIQDYAVAFFAKAFDKFDHIPAMSALAQMKFKPTTKKADALAALRRELAKDALERMDGLTYSLEAKGPVVVAKFLRGVATTWGLKLPADFLDTAKKYEVVSAETEGAKK